ncbi:hypothetical protein ACGFJ7_35525 [Actinoplanes sp. NPDC048988]|uniref:hypothetical protein n=1 Tax=Actinoplanes sp. NPDC048988 TaxID=3363901 RepID=UPI003712A717
MTTTVEARTAAIEAARQAAIASGSARQELITYKGKDVLLPVVSIPLELTLYSPTSHRIRAQILSAPEETQKLFQKEPWGERAQAFLEEQLRATEGYTRIKGALEADGQRYPGVVSHTGILVNANTRAAALRELGKQYIDVVVLPTDAMDKEFRAIEASLQMEEDVKQGYSNVNTLLFVRDLLQDYSKEEIGLLTWRELRAKGDRGRKEAATRVDQELSILQIIESVRARSNPPIPWTFFEGMRQSLLEIAGGYQKTAKTNAVKAARIRDARIVGMLAGLGYSKLREVDETLVASYLGDAFAESPVVGVVASRESSPDLTEPDGLDLFDDSEHVEQAASDRSTSVPFEELVTLLATTVDAPTVEISSVDGTTQTINRQQLLGGIATAYATAIETKSLDDAQGDEILAPTKLLKEATKRIDAARSSYDNVRNRQDFDTEAWKQAYEALDRAIQDLNDVFPFTGSA